MARLAPPENSRLKRQAGLNLGRYAFDLAGLATYLGGRERLPELCRQFGVPPVPSERPLTYGHLAVLVELAHRMGKPLAMHDFLVQVR